MRRFRFTTEWPLPHPPATVRALLEDVEHYPDWWPQVVACVKTGEDEGVVLCRSALPYTLELHLALSRRTPEVLESHLTGDLEGWVRWTVTAEREGCRVRFDEEVVVRGAALAVASYVGRPLLNWNHHVMLEGARDGMARRLTR